MTAPSRELPKDRLATTDPEGRRIYLYPADVKGFFRKLRDLSQGALIVVFLLVPWVKIHGAPLLRLDVANRRFTLFGTTFWGHEAPLLLFLLLGAGLLLFLVTAIFGRAWCGWACPQTVFIDGVYRRIERWLEGDAVTRKRRDAGPVNTHYLLIKTAKWAIFGVLSIFIGNSFLAYFVGIDELLRIVTLPPAENWASFLVMAGISGLTLFDFGWFREQFCIIACPYGRFQSVLLDDSSAVVAYDQKRGEPRRGTVAPASTAIGDCVDCFRCVQVCPTGVDIRRGVQLECIHCTACIDACDDVMTRIGKPKGLIRYATPLLARGEGDEQKKWRPQLSIRAAIYALALSGVTGGLSYAILHRTLFEVTLTRAIETPYQQLPGGRVTNHFKIDLRNLSTSEGRVRLQLAEPLERQGIKLVFVNAPPSIAPGKEHRGDLFVEFPKTILQTGHGKLEIRALVLDAADHPIIEPRLISAPLVGPYR